MLIRELASTSFRLIRYIPGAFPCVEKKASSRPIGVRALVLGEPRDALAGFAAHHQILRPATHRCYWSWARLLKRMLAIDADRCERCGSRMKLRAVVTLPASVERFLRHLGEPVEPLSPARGPPFFKSLSL